MRVAIISLGFFLGCFTLFHACSAIRPLMNECIPCYCDMACTYSLNCRAVRFSSQITGLDISYLLLNASGCAWSKFTLYHSHPGTPVLRHKLDANSVLSVLYWFTDSWDPNIYSCCFS
ncbi:hypothetical protein BDZ91DRAFT_553064 [Kalaharituber pfeilii]|nr:hypothetical protein BDZ91DRAFT_553064 [Kalaharituber pfeilii]